MDKVIPAWQKAIALVLMLCVAFGVFMLLGQLYRNSDPEDPEPREFRGW